MMRTETNHSDSTVSQISKSLTELPAPEKEVVISVPLPLVGGGLNQPFEAGRPEKAQQARVSTVQALAAHLAEKRGSTSVAPETVVTPDQATASLIMPLRAKLTLVFGGLIVLFLIVFGLTSWLFVQLTSQNQTSLAQHQRLEQFQQLQTAFIGEQAALGRLLAKGSPPNDFEFKSYQITAENNLFLLGQTSDDINYKLTLFGLKDRHTNLVIGCFTPAINYLSAGNGVAASQTWQNCGPQVEDLTARLVAQVEQQTSLVEEQNRRAAQQQRDGWFQLYLGAAIGAVVLSLLIWFANRFVIRPIGRLNVKLGHLLYGQTARITDRLNSLEFELDSQSKKIAGARHDLKLPLSNIRNAAEVTLLCQPALTEPVIESLKEIIETSDTSANQVNALLARGDDRLELDWVNLGGLVQRVVDLVDLRDFKVNIRTELTETILDSQLIEHVLLNLLSNARKFSTGGIAIGTRLVTNNAQLNTLAPQEAELWVWNDGPVINAHEREAVFRPGGQTASGRKVGGHGIGLSIVKAIAERHGGRVTVESHQKVGTTFRVFLPYFPKVAQETCDLPAEEV